MDWRMPVMDGLEATRRIRALDGGREVKIAVLSASVLSEEREQVLNGGADDFVFKPIHFDKIYDCMTALLGVKFIYAKPDDAEDVPESAGSSLQALEDLPETLKTDLRSALVSLDPPRIERSISAIADLVPALGSSLGQLAGQFKYTAILRALSPVYEQKTKNGEAE
jgi:CheY-like chemotaxis protein